MPKPSDDQSIQVIDGPTYKSNIEQFPGAEKDVQEVLDQLVKPALRANPIQPHRHGAGTPINHGILTVRVPNSAGGSGKRGGFRLVYHWDRHQKRLTKLSLTIRKDAESLSAKAVKKLLAEAASPKPTSKA